MAKTAFWNPAGRPSARMRWVVAGSRATLWKVQGVAVLHAGQRQQNEEGRDALGNGTCQRHAHHIQMADDDEEKVEQDVQHACDAQVVQRLFRLANGAEDALP
mgnify:CR=1 FL=1